MVVALKIKYSKVVSICPWRMSSGSKHLFHRCLVVISIFVEDNLFFRKRDEDEERRECSLMSLRMCIGGTCGYMWGREVDFTIPSAQYYSHRSKEDEGLSC